MNGGNWPPRSSRERIPFLASEENDMHCDRQPALYAQHTLVLLQ